MPRIPILSNMWRFLTAPALPRTSLAISQTHLSIVELRRNGRWLEPRHLGVLRLPAGLVRDHFTEPNITDEATFAEQLDRTITQADLPRRLRLSVALPEGSLRSTVITLEEVPGSYTELTQILNWKIERYFGCKVEQLRLSSQRLSSVKGPQQWFVTAAQTQVIEQYERIFRQIGLRAGLLTPRHLGEAQWLMREEFDHDQALLSLNEEGFVVVIVRDGEPLLVRSITCSREEREDEFYRLMVFYRDRLLPADRPVMLSRLLAIGSSEERRRFCNTAEMALEFRPQLLEPHHLGLRLDPHAPFNHFAAAAGLATLGLN